MRKSIQYHVQWSIKLKKYTSHHSYFTDNIDTRIGIDYESSSRHVRFTQTPRHRVAPSIFIIANLLWSHSQVEVYKVSGLSSVEILPGFFLVFWKVK